MKMHRWLGVLVLGVLTPMAGCSGEGFEVVLRNTSSAPVTSWRVLIDLNQATLGNVWSGTSTQSGSRITVRPMSYNTRAAGPHR